MNWDCLVLYVNCSLLSLHYVYILFMFVKKKKCMIYCLTFKYQEEIAWMYKKLSLVNQEQTDPNQYKRLNLDKGSSRL